MRSLQEYRRKSTLRNAREAHPARQFAMGPHCSLGGDVKVTERVFLLWTVVAWVWPAMGRYITREAATACTLRAPIRW